MLRILFNHFLPFALGLLVGTSVFYIFAPIGVPAPQNASYWEFESTSGRGSGSGSGSGSGWSCPSSRSRRSVGTEDATTSLQIISKPKAVYTPAARENNVEGSVLLKVTLLASGKVGDVSVVRSLPDGLTEQAIEAAKQIEFEPKRVNGVPVSVVRTIEYSFDIY